MQKETKYKALKFLAPTSLILLAIAIKYYWSSVCLSGGCSYDLMDKILDPVYYGAISLSIFFTFFLFLPARYLTSWLKYVFSWLFPVGVLVVVSNLSSGGGVFPIFARETIIMYSIFAAVVTLVFVGFKFYRERRQINYLG